MKKRFIESLLFIVLTITLSACVPDATVAVPTLDEIFGNATQERLIYISSETTPCGEARCLLSRDNEQDTWEALDFAIIGFEYQLNNAYTLRVREDVISGTTVLRLVDVVSQAFVEPETSEASTSDTDQDSETSTEPNTETANEVATESESEAATENQVVETTSEREYLLFVDQTLGVCRVDSDDRCLRVRESRNAEWQNLTGVIDGFDYVPSNYYVLQVFERTITTQSDTEKSQTIEYSLVDLVSQTPAIQEKLVYIGPEILSCDESAAERCYQYKESRALDYEAKAMDIIGFNHQDGYAYALNLLASLDENGQIRNYELIEVVSQELLADGRFVEKIIYVGPELAPCAYGPTNLCYVFKEGVDEPFRILSLDISGFRHQTGFDYELKVRQDLENTDQGLELVEVLYQNAVPVVEEQVEEEQAEETEVDTTEDTATNEVSEETEAEQDENTTEESTDIEAEESVEAEQDTIQEAVQDTANANEESTKNEESTEAEQTADVEQENEAEAILPMPLTPPTINQTIAGAAQAQLENTAAIDEDVERRSVTITVAPPAQAPLAVPTVTVEGTDTAEEEAILEVSEEVKTEEVEVEAIETRETESTTEPTTETTPEQSEEAVESTTENTLTDGSVLNQTDKSVPLRDYSDLEVVEERNKIIFIGSSYQECEFDNQPQWCYLTKDNLVEDWYTLAYGIVGFEYVEGFVYVIRVKESFYSDDPATGLPRFGLELIEIMAETEDKSYTLALEEERRKEEAAALEEAAIIAQTFEEEAAVLIDKEAEKAALEEQKRIAAAEADAIAADTQTAMKEAAEAAEAKARAEEARELAEQEAKIIEEDTLEAVAQAAAKAKEAEQLASEQLVAEQLAAEQLETEQLETATDSSSAQILDSANSTITLNENTSSDSISNVETSEAITTSGAPTTKTVFIGEELVSCQPEGLAEQLCYSYKENPEDDWQLLYNQIVNFEFFEGYIYELRVIENIAEDLPIELGRWFEVVEMQNAFLVTDDN